MRSSGMRSSEVPRDAFLGMRSSVGSSGGIRTGCDAREIMRSDSELSLGMRFLGMRSREG